MRESIRRLAIGMALVGLIGGPLPGLDVRAATSAYEFFDLGPSSLLDPNDPLCELYARGGEGLAPDGTVAGQRLNEDDTMVPATTGSGESAKMRKLTSPKIGGSALDINAGGVVAGYINLESETTFCGDYRRSAVPVTWADGERTELSTGEYGTGRADVINDEGVVAGVVSGGESLPVRWVEGELEVLPFPRAEMIGGNAYGVNNAGEIVGSCFLVDAATGLAFDFPTLWRDGKATELLVSGGSGGVGYAINDLGQVAGQIDATDETGAIVSRAVVWTNGQPADLPVPEGAIFSTAFAINAAGDVAGMVQTEDGRIAVVWIDGELHEVTELAGAPDGWVFSAAKDINDDGAITGYGEFDGAYHGFVLRPQG